VFHVANFPHYTGAPVVGRTGSISASRVEITAAGWSLQLDGREELKDIVKAVSQSGGYAVTHVGQLERSDGGLFDSDDATHVLDALGDLLSFASGARGQPFLLIGYDARGRAIWRTWEAPAATPWADRLSWFAPDDPTGLNRAFAGLMTKWADPHRREVFRRVVYLLTEANRRGIEPALIVAQAALEILAWQILVNEAKALSREGFDGLPAADMLRLLLSTSGIPLDIPADLTNLVAFAKAKSTLDGPQTVTLIRNSWVHPPKKAFSPGGPEIGEAWLLSLWYIDLVALRWLGFSGDYSARVRRGTVESVPWA
jgi:hypothetical protein